MGFLQGKIDETPEIVRDVVIYDTFVVQMRWLTPKQRDEIAKLSFEKRGSLEISRERHARAWTKRAIEGWRGLTVDIMTGPLHVVLKGDGAETQLRKVEKENGGSLPYSQEDAMLLYLSALPSKFADKLHQAMEELDSDSEAVEELTLGKSTPSSDI